MLVKKDVHPKEAPSDGIAVEDRGFLVKDEAAPFVVPYWHVERTSEADDSRINMRVTVRQEDVFGATVKFPVLVNTRKIQEQEPLVVFEEAPKAKAKASTDHGAKASGKGAKAQGKKAKAKA